MLVTALIQQFFRVNIRIRAVLYLEFPFGLDFWFFSIHNSLVVIKKLTSVVVGRVVPTLMVLEYRALMD